MLKWACWGGGAALGVAMKIPMAAPFRYVSASVTRAASQWTAATGAHVCGDWVEDQLLTAQMPSIEFPIQRPARSEHTDVFTHPGPYRVPIQAQASQPTRLLAKRCGWGGGGHCGVEGQVGQPSTHTNQPPVWAMINPRPSALEPHRGPCPTLHSPSSTLDP